MKYLCAFGTSFSTLLIYLGLPLLGWGIADLPGYFALGPRFGYALAVAGFALAVGYQYTVEPAGISGGKGDPTKRLRRQTVIGSVMVLFFFVMLVFLPYADRRDLGVLPTGMALRWIGLILAAAGYVLVFWSGWALGRMYSAEVTVQKDHHLITTGLYRSIRHPRYLGLILLAPGSTLVFRSWIGLLLCIPIIAVLLWRIFDEERVMHKEFGAEWEAYCRRSWRLIPLLF